MPYVGCPSSSSSSSSSSKLIIPIVYIFTINHFTCKWFNFQDAHGSYYIRYSVEQALLLLDKPEDRRRHPVILAANYRDCNQSWDVVKRWHPDLVTIDYTAIATNRTHDFIKYSDSLFMQTYMPELWSAAAIRFFVLEDVMVTYHYPTALHVEGDNLLYGDLTATIHALHSNYPGMAATPLTKTLDFVTASVLWVGALPSLQAFNDYMLRLGRRHGLTDFGRGYSNNDTHAHAHAHTHAMRENNAACGAACGARQVQTHGSLLALHQSHVDAKALRIKMNTTTPTGSDWERFTHWLRPFACCVKGGGVAPDSEGVGLKPFAVNEMAMLAHFSYLTTALRCPHELQFLPIMPVDLPALAGRLGLMTELVEVRFAAYHSGRLASTAGNATAGTAASATAAATATAAAAAAATATAAAAARAASTPPSSTAGTSSASITSNAAPHAAAALSVAYTSAANAAATQTLGAPLVGPDILGGIFDPNSWGQYLGGTHKKRGKDKGFTDRTHLAWEVVWYYKCTPKMRCSRRRVSVRAFNKTEIILPSVSVSAAATAAGSTPISTDLISGSAGGAAVGSGGPGSTVYRDTLCVTAPVVNCWNTSVHGHIPLWNLHVHSKHTQMYKSVPCNCADAV